MPEARWSGRFRALLGAKIILNDRMSIIDCVIKSISSCGAKLALADTLGVPNDFKLPIPMKCCSYRTRLIRRDADGIGVVFYPDSKRRYRARHQFAFLLAFLSRTPG
jgi:hypothetical protein